MAKLTKYDIIPEIKVTIEYYAGPIEVKDIIANRILLSKDKDFNPSYGLIADFRNAEANISKEDIICFINFLKSYPKLHGERRAAILTNTPPQVVASYFYVSQLGDLPMHVSFFSTLEAAMEWIVVSTEHKSLIEEKINGHKKLHDQED